MIIVIVAVAALVLVALYLWGAPFVTVALLVAVGIILFLLWQRGRFRPGPVSATQQTQKTKSEKTPEQKLREKSLLAWSILAAVVIALLSKETGEFIVKFPVLAMIFGLTVFVQTFYPNYMRSIRRVQKVAWCIGAVIFTGWILLPAIQTRTPEEWKFWEKIMKPQTLAVPMTKTKVAPKVPPGLVATGYSIHPGQKIYMQRLRPELPPPERWVKDEEKFHPITPWPEGELVRFTRNRGPRTIELYLKLPPELKIKDLKFY